MANYKKPQVTVEQSLTIAPISAEREQPAFVFGPNYQLHRYGVEDKAETKLGSWEGVETAYSYPDVKTDVEAVDKTYTRLYGENVVVRLADLVFDNATVLPEKSATGDSSDSSGIPVARVNENGGYTRLLFAGKKYVGNDLDDGLLRGIKVGDVLTIKYDSPGAENTVVVTTVTKAEYFSEEGQLDSDSYCEIVPGTLLTIADPIEIGTQNIDSITFCDNVSYAEFDRKNLTEVGNKWQWEDSSDIASYKDKIVVHNLHAVVTDYGSDPFTGDVLFADLYLTCRELVTAFADTIHSVSSVSGIFDLIGTIDPDNPLAMGVYMASLNAASDDGLESASVFFMATPTDDANGYAKVLDRATLTDKVYTLAPTTRDEAVIDMVQSHVMKMSSKTEKLWRIASVSKVVPEEIAKVSAIDNINGDEHYAIPVSPTAGTEPGANDYNCFRLVKSQTDPAGDTDARLRGLVVPGDHIRFFYRTDDWNEVVWDTYVVEKVLTNNTVMVNTDNGAIDVVDGLTPLEHNYKPEKIEIWHTRTSGQMAEAVASASRKLASRRMINVFPDVFKNDGVSLTGEFAACAIAGKISACEPQQPMTNLTVLGIDDVPIVYETYNKDELDLIASGGTFIIAQDLPNDKVYIRHQITTAYADGNLNTSELSITKNLDSISYAFADLFRPYIGKYNITPDFILGLGNLTSKLIGELGSDKGSVYGPQLIIQGTEILWVRQNELYKDHVDICVRLNLPYPCNFIDIVLVV